MGVINSIMAIWQVVKWIRAEKKELEQNADAYLTEDRAKLWRLNTEKIFYALHTGNGNVGKLPKPIRWFFASTTADNRLGEFGLWYLKSKKIALDDAELEKPISYRAH